MSPKKRTSGSPPRWLAAGIVLLGLSGIAQAAEDGAAGRIRTFESSFGPSISVAGAPAQRWTLEERMTHWKVPGLTIAVIRDGKLAWARGYGVLQAGSAEKVNAETVFSVGSVSKVGAAAATLRLVDAGQLDLDRPVDDYLRRWKVPGNRYTAIRPVTLRGILSHSAGLSQHGFRDFQPGEKLPTLLDTLDGRAPSRAAPVRVVYLPGSRFQYSGGGTTVEQLVIEDVTGLDFAQAARRYVLEPLGMTRSTYENPLPLAHGNIAKAHDGEGRPRALPRGYESMPEIAASGLWTTPSDYAKLVIALIESFQGRENSFLSTAVSRQMMTEVGRSPVGLGPFLDGEGLTRRFFHGGSNDSYKAWMEGHPATGDGVIIFTNGSNGDDLYPEVRRAVAAAEGWAPQMRGVVEVPAITLSSKDLAEKAGVYEVEAASGVVAFRHRSSAIAYRVVHETGNLYLTTDEREERSRLVPEDVSRFVMDAGRDIVRIEFVRSYDGRIVALLLRGAGGYVIEARKVAELPPG